MVQNISVATNAMELILPESKDHGMFSVMHVQIFDFISHGRAIEVQRGSSFMTFRIFVDYAASCTRGKFQKSLKKTLEFSPMCRGDYSPTNQ